MESNYIPTTAITTTNTSPPPLPASTLDTSLTEHLDNNDANRTMRQGLLLPPTSSRRATMVFRTVDHSQPPIADPANPAELNAQRQLEYERVQQLNHMMETVIQDFENAADNIKNFGETLDETDQLLDLWTQILSQTQHTKRLLDDASWQISGSTTNMSNTTQ
ncbi:DASH complex subunit Duo1-domain-containing protein [Halteromyces radiatus]|uniref:DASH complex subunit Duo1-domain-containing protein n=1 Tax=Halteromyces radiatus TaxID=101107 RepID=UPI00221EE4EF|nr:DASH complex subunit Duo1-domain-containing protein [Halteromyces radiatus]KAI8098990.1 DASH complex subunit Duo1-domain-containing protein [Halteromyces radiatus]